MSGQRVSQLHDLWWLNGEPQRSLSIKDRGLAYGDGLFETMRLANGQIPFLALHSARLARGLKALAIDLPVAQIIEQITRFSAAVAVLTDVAVVKVIVTRGVGGRGYAPDLSAPPAVILQALEAPAVGGDATVALAVSRMKLAEQPKLAGIKHLNRLEYVLAAAEVAKRQPEAVALLLSDQEYVVESLHHNIFCVQGGHLYTPALNQCGVAGVLRRWLLDELAPSLEMPCMVLPLTLAELYSADEVFIGNSVRGFTPVTELIAEQQKTRFDRGSVCQQLQCAYLAKLAQ